MLEEARKQCKKSAKTRIIVCLVLIVIGMAAPLLAPIQFLLGPKKLSGKTDLNYDSYKNKYVEFDIEYVFDYYVETTTKTTKNGKVVSSKKTSYGYVVYNWDDNTCFAVELPVKYDDTMNDIMDETVEYFYYGTKPKTTLKVKGTFEVLKGQELTYYKETLKDLEDAIPGITDASVMYKLTADTVNGIKTDFVYLIYVAVAILIIVILYTVIRMKTGAADSKLKKFLTANAGITEEQVGSDMNSATRIGKTVWAGKRFTVWTVGLYMYIINNKNLVWAYYFQRTGRNAVSQVRTFNKDHKMVAINLSKELSNQLLSAYQETQPQMVLGYKKELEKQYNKDFSGFLNLRYNQAQNAAPENEYDDYFNTQFRTEDYAAAEDTSKKYDD